MLRRKKGQNTLEYVLLFTAVTLAIIYGVKTVLAPKLQSQMVASGALVDKAKTAFTNSSGTP